MSKINHSHRFSILVLRWLLALAILAGTFAVLPEPAQAAVDATAANPVLKARIVNETLTLTATNLVPNRYYYVRARTTLVSVKLGKVRASKQGKVDTSFTLKGKLLKSRSIRVCLKDIMNGKTYCTTATKR